VSLLKDLLILPQMTVTGAESSGASFGPKDSKTPRYCATHKPVGYVNVKTQCQEDGCYKFPHFGFSDSKATSCVTHMKEGMIHLRVRKCLEPGCITRVVFNVVGSDKGKFCAKHKKPEMIDIQTKICKYPGESAHTQIVILVLILMSREKHKANTALDTKQLKKVHVFAKPTETLKWLMLLARSVIILIVKKEHYMEYLVIKCHDASHIKTKVRKHSTDNMVDLVQKICSNCGLLDILLQDQKCADCSTYAKAKARVQAYDSIVEDGVCSKKRPDFVIDADTHKVVLEVDEYQHKKGEYNCEVKRMWDIAQALGIPTLFIRYNPDSYRMFNGITKDSNDRKRKQELLMCLSDAVKSPPAEESQFLRVVYLFYDGYDSTKYKITTIPEVWFKNEIHEKADKAL
ncbi:4427_t:CDS:2, partial [Funneliformis caledonium]